MKDALINLNVWTSLLYRVFRKYVIEILSCRKVKIAEEPSRIRSITTETSDSRFRFVQPTDE